MYGRHVHDVEIGCWYILTELSVLNVWNNYQIGKAGLQIIYIYCRLIGNLNHIITL